MTECKHCIVQSRFLSTLSVVLLFIGIFSLFLRLTNVSIDVNSWVVLVYSKNKFLPSSDWWGIDPTITSNDPNLNNSRLLIRKGDYYIKNVKQLVHSCYEYKIESSIYPLRSGTFCYPVLVVTGESFLT